MPAWIGKWEGGRVYQDRRKRSVHVIERMIDGRRYTVRLPPNVKDPGAELALFLRDPEGYKQRNESTGLLPDEAAVLTLDEVTSFEGYQRGQHMAEGYVRAVSSYLTDWANALKGRDLRRVTVSDLYRLLDRWETARNYRINALRAYCTYLVRRQRLKPAENAAGLLEVTKPPPRRALERQGYTIAEVEAFYRCLDSQRLRDYYLIAAKCGLHGTEIGRIARGEVEITPVGRGGIAAVLRFIHKSGRDHRQSIDAQTLAAVRRLMALGKAPGTKIVSNWANQAGARSVRVVHHGRLRHSVVTWLRGGQFRRYAVTSEGMALSEIAAMIGHRSLLMAKDHYDNTEVPELRLPTINLTHPEDPTPLDIGAGERTKAAG